MLREKSLSQVGEIEVRRSGLRMDAALAYTGCSCNCAALTRMRDDRNGDGFWAESGCNLAGLWR